jgi:hypothetical protein
MKPPVTTVFDDIGGNKKAGRCPVFLFGFSSNISPGRLGNKPLMVFYGSSWNVSEVLSVTERC